MHVGTPNEEVEREIRERAARGGATPKQTEEYVRIALARHEENREQYRAVMSGRLS
jgi:hypothetical protein